MGRGGEGDKGFLQGVVGGRSLTNNIDGGFGGGAGPFGNGGGAGGGGGYSGGSSGDNESDSCGGGGGSYNAGKNQLNECCYKTAGHGQVTITWFKKVTCKIKQNECAVMGFISRSSSLPNMSQLLMFGIVND